MIHAPTPGRALLENVFILAIIALLLMGILPSMQRFMDYIKDTKIRMIGETFQENLSILHTRWQLHPQTFIGSVHFSAEGWPDASVYASAEQGLSTCRGLWQAIMAENHLETNTTANDDGSRFLIEHPAAGICLYRFSGNESIHTRLLLYRVGSSYVQIVIH